MTSTPRRLRATTALLVAAGVLAACAPADPRTTPMSSQSPTPGPDRSPRPTPSGSPQPAPTEVQDLPVPSGGTTVSATGTVTEGVESGCLLLTSDGTTYLLLGSHDRLVVGSRVTVEGTLARDVMTTCQQGVPLQVRSVVVGDVAAP